MATFLEEKMAAVEIEAARRARNRARWAAIVGVALLTATAATGAAWLAIPAAVALLVSLFWFLVFQNLKRRLPASIDLSQRASPVAGAKRAASEIEPETESAAQPAPEPAGPVIEDRVSLRLSLPRPLTLPTESGEAVAFDAGPREVSFRLFFAPERESRDRDAIDYPGCDLRLRDDEGTWWQVSTFLDPGALTQPLETGVGPICFWADAPGAWWEALQSSCLITGVASLLDSRERIELSVGDRAVTIMFKNQGPQIDVAWLGSEGKLVVRAAKMHYERWKDGEFDDIVDGVTFGYLLDPEDILLPTAPAAHWGQWSAWEEDSGEERPWPTLSRVSEARDG